MIYRRLKYSTKICINFINFSENNVSNIFQSILMNCNYFQQLTKDTVINRKKVSSALKEEIYRNNSSVKDMKFHRKIAVLIPKLYFQRYILENMMKCRHFLVDILPGMCETNFMVFPVFQSVLLSGRL